MNTEQKTINEMFSSAGDIVHLRFKKLERRMQKILMEKNKEIKRLSEMIHLRNTAITVLRNRLILIDERCTAEIESKGEWDAGQTILEIQEMVHECAE